MHIRHEPRRPRTSAGGTPGKTTASRQSFKTRRGSLPLVLPVVPQSSTLGMRRSSSDTLAFIAAVTGVSVKEDVQHQEVPTCSTPLVKSRLASKLSIEVISIILDFVLSSPDFGDNGRWSGDVEASKERWVTAHKEWAFLHRKFSLIHHSWTPHVLRSLWERPRLTSRRAIEKFADCINHPEKLWGYGHNPPIIAERSSLVRLLSYGVGAGRYSSTDYILYSGAWIAETSWPLLVKLHRYTGMEVEGWCSVSCSESPIFMDHDIVSWPNRDVTRISLIRSPVQACLMDMTIRSSPFLETIELIDVGARLGEEGRLISLLKLQSETLIFLALKLNHTPEARGLLDTVLAVCPKLEILQVQHDLLSPRFFSQKLPSNLQILLIGSSVGPPIVFSGQASLSQLWERAAARWPVLAISWDDSSVGQAYGHSTSFHSTDRPRHPHINQNRPSTENRQRAVSEEEATIDPDDIAEWMNTEMRSPAFWPKPLGPRETALVAAALCK